MDVCLAIGLNEIINDLMDSLNVTVCLNGFCNSQVFMDVCSDLINGLLDVRMDGWPNV